jgi:hypothetical protein
MYVSFEVTKSDGRGMFECGHRVFWGGTIPSAVSKRNRSGPIEIRVSGHRDTLA